MRELVISDKLEKKYKPLDQATLQVEAKLSRLNVTPDGKIQGVTPMKNSANHTLPKNSAYKRIENLNLIIAPLNTGAILVVDEVK